MSAPSTEHCFYCHTASLTIEEVTEHVQLLVSHVEGEILRRSSTYVPNCKFTINMPKKAGQTQRHCYLWLTNKEVYRMLNGLNYDGRKITSKNSEADPSQMTAREQLSLMDWSDASTSDYCHYIPPTLDGFQLGEVTLERVSRTYVEGKLFCSTPLPESFQSRWLNELFLPFVTDGHVDVYRSRNSATVTFSRRDDAYFALCMRRKVIEPHSGIELSFNYCKAR